MVLEDQEFTSYQMRVGEILLSRNWITEQTLKFFLKDIFEIQKTKHLPIGKCLKYAGLMTDRQIQNVLQEQSKCWMKFGEVAVLHNYLRQETLDFFEEYFFQKKKLISLWGPCYNRLDLFQGRNWRSVYNIKLNILIFGLGKF
ncbi:MAG: hypothetical protein HC796_00785 [Synechococcaceae cyanobacterium RL_1_2]|nr:hypothetical protein [Synechococcaceae cyanobacterium RL_1_2]